jgi:hypothetical protein
MRADDSERRSPAGRCLQMALCCRNVPRGPAAPRRCEGSR